MQPASTATISDLVISPIIVREAEHNGDFQLYVKHHARRITSYVLGITCGREWHAMPGEKLRDPLFQANDELFYRFRGQRPEI